MHYVMQVLVTCQLWLDGVTVYCCCLLSQYLWAGYSQAVYQQIVGID